MRPGLELRGGDVDSETPAGFGRPESDPAAIQDYLRSAVSPDDEVTLELDEVVEGLPDRGVSYRIMHRRNLIGSTSAQFSRALSAYFGRGRGPARSVIGCHIEYVEAVRGGRVAGASVGAGDYGVWLAPRLGGLTRFEYDRTEASDGDE